MTDRPVNSENEATKEYAAEYEHAGCKWALNFYARDDEDAAEKMASLRESVQLLGHLASRIPCQFIPHGIHKTR